MPRLWITLTGNPFNRLLKIDINLANNVLWKSNSSISRALQYCHHLSQDCEREEKMARWRSPRITLDFPISYRMDEDAVGPRKKHKMDQLRARLCMEKVRKPCVQ